MRNDLVNFVVNVVPWLAFCGLVAFVLAFLIEACL